MNKINRDSSLQELYDYWNDVMNYRMDIDLEVSRLISSGLGFYYKHLQYEKDYNTSYTEHENFLDFIENNKRPWGNKNIQQSIIFQLGWDCQWVMSLSFYVPDEVTDEANKLYASVINYIKEHGDEYL